MRYLVAIEVNGSRSESYRDADSMPEAAESASKAIMRDMDIAESRAGERYGRKYVRYTARNGRTVATLDVFHSRDGGLS